MRQWVLLSAIVLSAKLFATTYNFYLNDFPKESPDCATLAGQLGDRFTQATGLLTSIALCERETPYGYDIKIQYENDVKVPVVTTWQQSMLHPGRFATREECLAILPTEKELYIHETGLAPTFAYCQRTDLTDKKIWGPRIDGFGKPIKNFFINGFALFTVPDKAVPLRARLKEMLPKENAAFVDVVVQSHGAYADVAIHYYAAKKLSFTNEDGIRANRREICDQQVAQWTRIFTTIGQEPIVSFCGTPVIKTHYEMSSIFTGEAKLNQARGQERFDSYELCEAATASLVTKYSNALKQKVAGIVCSLEEKKYQPAILYEP